MSFESKYSQIVGVGGYCVFGIMKYALCIYISQGKKIDGLNDLKKLYLLVPSRPQL